MDPASASGDDLNATQWAAVVLWLLILLVPVAVLLAALCKRAYARAVVRLQSAVGRASLPPPPPVPDERAPAGSPVATPSPDAPGATSAPPLANRPPLTLRIQSAAEVPALGSDPSVPARGLRRRVNALQFAAGLGYWWVLLMALLIALLMFEQLGGELGDDDGQAFGTLAAHAVVWPMLLLPPLLGWAFTAGLDESRVWLAMGLATLLFGAGFVAGGVGWLPAFVFAGVAAVLAAMMAAFLRPAVRGAGPPLVAALTVAVLVFSVVAALSVWLDPYDDEGPLTGEDWAFGLGAIAVALAVAAAVGWRVLRRLARRYAAKRFSDVQLAQGAYWGLITTFTAGLALSLSFESSTGATMEWVAAAILLLWWAWRLLQRLALWLLARRGAPPPLPALLMLRVFKPSARSEGFTDRFLARWRFAGPVWMIAGPDLAGAYMEPDEFLAFVDRSLHRRFIADAAELPARLAALDGARDPDGRCRVSELFCSNHTWQPAVLALMDRAGVVLLDLREYGPARAGTRFELEQVLARVPLARVLVVVDADAPLDATAAEVQRAWQHVGASAPDPNARPAPTTPATPITPTAPTLRLLQVGRGSAAEMRGLLRAAAQAAVS